LTPYVASCSYFTPPSPVASSTLSLHDALPICRPGVAARSGPVGQPGADRSGALRRGGPAGDQRRSPEGPAPAALHHRLVLLLLRDRKSTRLNSSHVKISYAVFCLKKKKENQIT